MGEQGLSDPLSDIYAHFVTRSGLVLWAAVDREGQVIEANVAFEAVFGSGRSLDQLAVLADGGAWSDLLDAPTASVLSLTPMAASATAVVRLYPDGNRVHLLGIRAQPDELLSRVSTDFAALAFSDRRERRSLLNRADESSRSAMTDPLTGLANRRRLDQRMLELEPEGLLSAAMVDIDHFKAVNDGYGHAAGDVVLAQVAAMLGFQVRETDLAGRYGGEEFVVLFPGTLMAQAAEAAERMRAVIEQAPCLPDGGSVTVSIGVAERHVGEAPQDTVVRADAALYRAKESGRNRIVTWEPAP